MMRIGSGCLCVATLLTSSCLTAQASGDEPVDAFLRGLRSRRYYDTALDYLNQIESDPNVPDKLKEVLDLEKAVTLMAACESERDRVVRRQHLDQAQQLLRQFVGQHPEHVKANNARTQLGNLVAQRARLELDEAKRGNRSEHLKEARRLYDEARQVFVDHQAVIRKPLEAIPKILDRSDKEQAALAERRTQLRADYVQTQIFATAILEETADTFEKGSQEHTDLLVQASQEYESIYKKYRTLLAGLYARLYQGRTNQELGKYRDALGFYVELLDQPDTPDAFRVLKTKTLRLAVDCWLHESQNKYLEVIRRCSEWTMKARPEEAQHSDWLYLRLSLARAHLKRADEATPQSNRQAIASRNEAEKQAKVVARYESEFRREAQQILVKLGRRDRSGDEVEIRDFAGARVVARETLDLAEGALASVADLEKQVSESQSAQLTAELQSQLEESRLAQQSAQASAIEACRLALKLADSESAIEDVNLVRYFLSFLYYRQQEYYEAALMGEFVARHYSDSASARQCANIAMACYSQLHHSENGSDKRFEADRIVSIAEFIVDRWPDRPEAEGALATLITFMINSQKLDLALRFLNQLPDDSSIKSAAALKTGTALWQSYQLKVNDRRRARSDAAAGESDLPADLTGLKSSAYEVLAAGIDGFSETGNVDSATVTATLCFAQACLEMEQVSKSIEILEAASTGPLTLVRAKHPATNVPGLVEDTYKTALRAYISSLPNAADRAAVIGTTQWVMQEMTAAFGGSPEGQRQLVRVYVSIARELEEQLKVAGPATKDALSQGFETFLARLGTEATEPNILTWVAETFASLGAGFDSGGTLDATAARYYQQSADTFQKLLDRAPSDPATKLQLQVRLASVRRSQRDFKSSMELLCTVLAEKNMTLNVQVEAANTLQQWAATEQGDERTAIYERAIKGDCPNPNRRGNIVWGWGQIATITANRPKFRDSFHTARLNLAECRFRMAELKQGAEREQLFETAKKDISLTKRLYGLGDGRWPAQYDALLKQIQAAGGVDR